MQVPLPVPASHPSKGVGSGHLSYRVSYIKSSDRAFPPSVLLRLFFTDCKSLCMAFALH